MVSCQEALNTLITNLPMVMTSQKALNTQAIILQSVKLNQEVLNVLMINLQSVKARQKSTDSQAEHPGCGLTKPAMPAGFQVNLHANFIIY